MALAILKAIGLKGGIAIALGFALVALMIRADQISKSREAFRTALATERANHAVTRNSVDVLQESLAKYVGAGRASRIAQLAAVEKQAEKSAAMRFQAEQIRSMIDDLDPNEICRTPDFVMGN